MHDHNVKSRPVATPTDEELAEVVAYHQKVKAMIEDPLQLARALVRVLEAQRREEVRS